jgi:hypothetical protein
LVACESSPGNVYTIAAVVDASSYTWTVPVGATIVSGQGSTSIDVTFGTNTGSIAVSSSNMCGTSTSTSIAITLSSAAPATPGTIAGSLSICELTSANVYSIAPVNGATTYTWTIPVGSTITSGQGSTSIMLDAGTQSGNLEVIASSTCGTSQASISLLTINPIPVVSQADYSPVCINWSPLSLSNGTPAGGIYSGTGVTAGSFDPSQAGAGTFSINYVYSLNGCSDSALATITVNACAGIEDLESSLLVLYPNPTSGMLTMKGIDLETMKTIDLLDEMGRLVHTWKVTSEEMIFDMHSYAKGSYTLRISGSLYTVTKFVQLH